MTKSQLYGFENVVAIPGGSNNPITYDGVNSVPVNAIQLPNGTWALQVYSSENGQGVLYGADSEFNTTTTPLGADETFTGTFEKNYFPDIGCIVQTDQAGTLYFDFSPDAINWSTFPTNGFDVAAGINEFHTAVKLPRYFRIRYVNGSVAQTYLRIYTYFGVFRQGNAPLNQSIAGDSDAILVRSISSALDLAFGNIGGQREDTKFGGVRGLQSATGVVDVWRFADTSLSSRQSTKTFPTTAQSLYLSSDSNLDTGVTVAVNYLDSDGVRQITNFALNGSDSRTTVDLGVTGLDCNTMRIVTPVNGSNVGNIYLNTESARTNGIPDTLSTVLCFIPAAKGRSQQALDRVPSNKKQRIKKLNVILARDGVNGGAGDFFLEIAQPGEAWNTIKDFQITTSVDLTEDVAGLILQPLAKIRARGSATNANTGITVEWTFDEIDA